ncbi:MAG TPA: hypothetical protein VGL81_21285 [Polyangiaceae bacterium]|jgi:hypothetical protein
MGVPVAGQSLAGLLVFTQHLLAGSQQKLGNIVGVNRRTVWRWQAGKARPTNAALGTFARLVHPKDPALAAALAAAAGQDLVSLGIVPPPPVDPPPPAVPPPLAPVQIRLLVDAIVCAAAEALDVSPRAVRPALFAAFACAREASLPLATVEKALAPVTRSRPKA